MNNPGYRGHLLWNPDDLLTLTSFAVRRGWKIGTHAIGDRTVRTLLDVYEQVIAALPSCLNKPGGDMMSPVVRAEKAAEAEGSAHYRQESLCPVVTLRQAWRLGMNKEEGDD